MESAQVRKDYSISLVRLIAMIFIIFCHIMQCLGNELAWWFNVGVQIFLCMSGYLYGRKFVPEISDVAFCKKQFVKILRDYYLVIILALPIEALLIPSQLTLERIAGALLLFGTLPGGEHLWYIPYILLCYFLTPLYIRYFEDRLRRGKRALPGLFLILLLQILLQHTFLPYFEAAWLGCYVIGLFIGFCEKHSLAAGVTAQKIIFAAAPIMNGFQIYVNYFWGPSMHWIVGFFYNMFCSYAHVALGCFLFYALRALFARLFIRGVQAPIISLCNFSDCCSYDIYLVHQFFILGSFSLVELTPWLPVNVLLIFVLVLFLGWGLHALSVALPGGHRLSR